MDLVQRVRIQPVYSPTKSEDDRYDEDLATDGYDQGCL
jgi:hypothetical protein